MRKFVISTGLLLVPYIIITVMLLQLAPFLPPCTEW